MAKSGVSFSDFMTDLIIFGISALAATAAENARRRYEEQQLAAQPAEVFAEPWVQPKCATEGCYGHPCSWCGYCNSCVSPHCGDCGCGFGCGTCLGV